MTTYERNGVHVDQCTECRGLFLDRGELERLISAESNWQGQAQRQPNPPSTPTPGYSDYAYKKRKRSFLDELFY